MEEKCVRVPGKLQENYKRTTNQLRVNCKSKQNNGIILGKIKLIEEIK